jgi:hypothetical protein
MATDDLPAPPPPPDLSPTSAALWAEVTDAMELAPAELRLLAEGLHALDLAAECRQVLDAEGLTVQHASGAPKAHPLLADLGRARVFYASVVKQLGLQLPPEPAPSTFARKKPGPKPHVARER